MRAVDHKENFVQNFFSRVMDMKIAQDSESLKTFLSDAAMAKLKHKEPSNMTQAVS